MAVRNDEWGILCCAVKDQNVLAECEMEGLSPYDFKTPLYRYMYSKMVDMYVESKRIIDEVTLRTMCDSGLDVLLTAEKINKAQLFNALFTNQVNPVNASAFIASVMDESIKMALNEDLDLFDQERKKDQASSGQMVSTLEDLLQRAYQRQAPEKPTLLGGGSGLFEQMLAREQVQIAGMATPWPTLNDRLSGLAPGTLTLWVSPTGTGKTSAMLNLASKLSITDNNPGLFISTEMDVTSMTLRLVSMRSGVPEKLLRLNKDWQDSPKMLEQVRKACYDIDNVSGLHYLLMPDFTLSKVRGHGIRMRMRYGIRYMIFDYVSEPDDSDTKNRSEWQNLSQFMWRMKGLAVKLGIAIVVTGQSAILSAARDFMTLQDIALAKYMSFHCDHIIGVINKSAKTLESEAAMPVSGLIGLGNQKMYIMKGRHGGETHDASQHAYINMNYEREILRITEGVYPPLTSQVRR